MHFIAKALILIVFPNICYPIKISEFIPKFKVENLKASIESKNIYYFQNNQGQLLVNKNFKNHVVLEGSKRNTFYNLTPNNNQTIIIIEKDKNYQTNLNIRKNKEIFLSEVGKTITTKIGEGQYPQIFDNWVTFLDLEKQKIYYLNLNSTQKIFSISFLSPINPYYRPQVYLAKGHLYYTKIFEDGHEGIIRYSLKNRTSEKVYVDPEKGRKAYLLGYKDQVFVSFYDKTLLRTVLAKLTPKLEKVASIPGVVYGLEYFKDTLFYITRDIDLYYLSSVSMKNFKHKKVKSFNQYLSLLKQGDDLFINQQGKISKIIL